MLFQISAIVTFSTKQMANKPSTLKKQISFLWRL